jgi:copper chaperone
MISHQIFVENMKCGGCMNSIKTSLLKIKGVTSVNILKEEDKVIVTGVAVEKADVIDKLSSLGYPEKGSNNILCKTKYFVSCAMGRMS